MKTTTRHQTESQDRDIFSKASISGNDSGLMPLVRHLENLEEEIVYLEKKNIELAKKIEKYCVKIVYLQNRSDMIKNPELRKLFLEMMRVD